MTTDTRGVSLANTRGIVAMIGAMVCFTATDALMKGATASLPPSEIIAIRGVVATLLLVAFMRSQGPLRGLGQVASPRVAQRTLFEAVFIVTYVIALSLAPFAIVFSVLQSAPIMITAFAAFIWRDQVGWRRWAAVFVGFAGVALVIKPSPQGLEPAMALALVAALMVAGRDLSTRAVPKTVPSQVITLASTAGMAAVGFLLAPFETWSWPSAVVWWQLVGAGVSVALGVYLVIYAYRTAETSAISPFRYASVPFAILIGWLVWGQVPDRLAMTGIALIVGCGLYMMHRERISQKR
ncbi:MAG: DMT family transporter [Beijerinckiaceae bacterium]